MKTRPSKESPDARYLANLTKIRTLFDQRVAEGEGGVKIYGYQADDELLVCALIARPDGKRIVAAIRMPIGE